MGVPGESELRQVSVRQGKSSVKGKKRRAE